ncbi:MAG: hypothetical protein K2K35_08590 [Lachnospiraceae bacterium]|nr:hypothetical protein [Lachnospiraceae bacterium]
MDKLDFANPVYNDTTGKATWSMLYFGTYPQAEVKGNTLVPAITQAEYDENGDAYVSGTKYRRISKDNTENNENFGNSIFRYFKWEKIKWRVLWNDGDTLFVMADKGIDCKAYNNINISITWEECTLRHWLANDFCNMAFNTSEQNVIKIHNVNNQAAPGYMKGNGRDTEDKIYILSIPEIRNTDYGLWDKRIDWEHKKDKKINRRIKPTDYAYARGVSLGNVMGDYKKNCNWWLRSACSYTNYGAEINCEGGVFKVGFHTRIFCNAVVPVMHIGIKELQNLL